MFEFEGEFKIHDFFRQFYHLLTKKAEQPQMYCDLMCCTVLSFAVLFAVYCTVLFCSVLYCTVL